MAFDDDWKASQGAGASGSFDDGWKASQTRPDADINKEAVTTPPKQRSWSDRALGVGESALATVTGALSGTAATVSSALEIPVDVVKNVYHGQSVPEAFNSATNTSQNNVEQRSATTTYQPRTEAGQEYTRNVGDVSANVLMPLGAEAQLLDVPVPKPVKAVDESGVVKLRRDINTANDLRKDAQMANTEKMTSYFPDNASYSAFKSAKKQKYNDFVADTGLAKEGKNGGYITDENGLYRTTDEALGQRIKDLNDINAAGGKVGLKTLYEQSSEQEKNLLSKYGIQPSGLEEASNVISSIPGDIAERVGLREAGLDTSRANAASKVAGEKFSKIYPVAQSFKETADEVNAAYKEQQKNGPASPQMDLFSDNSGGTRIPEYQYTEKDVATANANADVFKDLNDIAQSISSKNYNKAQALSEEFHRKWGKGPAEASEQQLSVSPDLLSKAHDIHSELKTLRRFGEKGKEGNVSDAVSNLMGRGLALAGLYTVGGPFTALGVAGGKMLLGRGVTRSAAENLSEAGTAFNGRPVMPTRYTSPTFNASPSQALGGYVPPTAPQSQQETTSPSTNADVPQVAQSAQRAPEEPTFDPQVTKLYVALAHAETGSESNRWIRTKVSVGNGKTSTAYGPAQLTHDRAASWYAKHRNELTDGEQRYMEAFLAQGEQMKRAGEKDETFGLGKSGVLTGPNAKAMYARVVRKMLNTTLKEHNGNVVAAVKDWRGANDIPYFNKVLSVM